MQRYSSKVFNNKTNLVTDHQEQDGVGFSAASLSMKAQKKIASKLSTRKITKLFLSDAVDRVFDTLYSALLTHYSKKDAEKVVKNIIKLAVKLGLLARNDMLDKEDLRQLNDVQKQLHSLSLTIISFVQITSNQKWDRRSSGGDSQKITGGNVKYSFERTHLIELLKQLQHSLAPLVSLKLSDKSTRRLEHVIVHLSSTDFLDGLFKVDGPHAGVLSQFVDSLEGLLEAEGL